MTDRGDPISILKKRQDHNKFVIGNDETELELSVESRSFVNRVNDQVRKRQTNFKCYRRWRETFYDLVDVHDCNNGISSIHGKELPEQMSLHYGYDRSHTQTNVRHIYELVSEQDEISGLDTIGWENNSWRYLSLICDERIVNLQRTNIYVFSDSVLCFGKILENPQSNEACGQRLAW